jgi:5'-nucleotidase
VSSLTLLHTNDLHNRLRWSQVERLQALKATLAPTLLLDAGDAVGSGNLGFKPWGEAILDRMNAAGYDAMALGNREFHPWRFAMWQKIKRACFPVLCANLLPKEGRDSSGVRPAVMLTLPSGERVGVFGLLVEMVTPAMWAARWSDFLFDDPLQTARAWATRLRQEADWVVCLSHLGWERDQELAEAVPELDAILGGHSHTPLEHPQRVGSVWVVQSAPFARAVGCLTLTRRKGIVYASGELLPL